MPERHSALRSAEPRAGRREPQPPARRSIIGEVRGFALLQVAAFPGTVVALRSAVRLTLGVDLPQDLTASRRGGEFCVFKVGAERFWIVGADDTRAAVTAWSNSVREAVPPAMGSVTSLSHARTRLFIEGPAARAVLSQGIALDLHPDAFRCEGSALTALEDTPVLLHRTGPERYELYVLRTYAGWIWEWLTDAALPLGYEVGERSHSAMPADAGTGR